MFFLDTAMSCGTFLSIYIVFWIIGAFLGLFVLGQAITVLLFGIPFSNKLIQAGVMNGSGPIPRYLLSITILSGVFALATWATHSWAPKRVEPYWIGVIAMQFVGLFKGMFGESDLNIKEYLQTNAEFIDPIALQRWLHQSR